MIEPKVNGGIHGHLKFNPELTEALEKEITRLKENYPVTDVRIYLAEVTDKRWKNYNGKEKTEKI